ncbi:MAG: hypothetical protein NTZ98_21490 [Acidobacteria bacterium]|nr:hypothetical protein [Acidobacteriota bacterium]
MTHLAPLAHLLEQRDHARLQVVAPALLELLEQVRRPAHGVAARGIDVRLVGENAGQRAAEFGGQRFLVAAHGDLDKLLGDAGLDQVHVGKAAVPFGPAAVGDALEAVVLAFAARLGGRAGGHLGEAIAGLLQDQGELRGGFPIELRQLLQRQTLALVVRFGHLGGHVAAGEPAGVGVLVVEPDLHAQLLPLLDRITAKLEPAVGEVRRDHARAGMNEDAVDALGLEFGQVKVDVGFRHLAVPDQEGEGAELGRRRGKQLPQPRPGVRGRGSSASHAAKQQAEYG